MEKIAQAGQLTGTPEGFAPNPTKLVDWALTVMPTPVRKAMS